MSQTQNQHKSGPRNSGNRRRNNQRRPSGQGQHSHSHTPAPKKKTLVQKLLGLVGLGKTKPAARPASGARTSQPAQREQGPGKVIRTSTPRPARKPEQVEVTNPRLYIGNLSYDATEADLEEVFNGVGRVNSIEIVTNSRTQRSKGYGFVEMGSTEEAKRAVETLHDQELMGRKLVVSGAKPKDDRESPEQA
jgi:hypothetical protein